MTNSKFTLSKQELSELIEEPYLSRGEDYFLSGSVELLTISSSLVESRALGTRSYRVVLKRSAGKLDGECTCPAFLDFGPCKHMAATGFALMEHNINGYIPSETFLEEIQVYDRVEKSLQEKSKEELIHLIMEIIGDDVEWLYQLDEE